MDTRNENRREENLNNRHLYGLNELEDYKVASDDPDVRGWTIVDRDNHEFGVIQELIVDPEQEKVRYLDVVPKHSGSGASEENHMLIPIGVARIDHDQNRVLVTEIDKDLLNGYPTHKTEPITRDYEYLVVDRFNRVDNNFQPGDRERRDNSDFYNNKFYDEDRFYTNRNRNGL